ncbi:MAG: hypothetical protein KKA54_03490 [Proteobacteria bacterium]|nr:hypothetical protein [Pseudomonadota bacterium]
MGKLSRLRLRPPSKDKKKEEGVGEAELAVLSGTVLAPNGKNSRPQVEGKDVSPAPPFSRRKPKSGK